MSQFHSRNIKGAKWLNLAEYNFWDYWIHIDSTSITPEVNTNFIDLSNRDGCCISPTVYWCTRISFKWTIFCPGDACLMQKALDYLSCYLILPEDRDCWEFFDIEFSDECDERYFTTGKITRPLKVDNIDKFCCKVDFSFEISLEKPEYYKLKTWLVPCTEECCEPQLFCKWKDWLLDDEECCDRMKVETSMDFCRRIVDDNICFDWFDKECIRNENLCILNNNGNYKATPRISSTWPIECLSILNMTNGSELTLSWSFNSLVVETDWTNLIVMDGQTNKNNTRESWWGITLNKWENCLTVEGVGEGEICFQWYDTYQFTG